MPQRLHLNSSTHSITARTTTTPLTRFGTRRSRANTQTNKQTHVKNLTYLVNLLRCWINVMSFQVPTDDADADASLSSRPAAQASWPIWNIRAPVRRAAQWLCRSPSSTTVPGPFQPLSTCKTHEGPTALRTGNCPEPKGNRRRENEVDGRSEITSVILLLFIAPERNSYMC